MTIERRHRYKVLDNWRFGVRGVNPPCGPPDVGPIRSGSYRISPADPLFGELLPVPPPPSPGTQAARIQARSVFRPGGLPCISSPIRKTLAATHTAPTTAAAPTAIDSQTSHQGGGWVEAMRMSIP